MGKIWHFFRYRDDFVMAGCHWIDRIRESGGNWTYNRLATAYLQQTITHFVTVWTAMTDNGNLFVDNSNPPLLCNHSQPEMYSDCLSRFRLCQGEGGPLGFKFAGVGFHYDKLPFYASSCFLWIALFLFLGILFLGDSGWSREDRRRPQNSMDGGNYVNSVHPLFDNLSAIWYDFLPCPFMVGVVIWYVVKNVNDVSFVALYPRLQCNRWRQDLFC